jgi:hypothetical protein
MEELFKESFNYARIQVFKNYSDRFSMHKIINAPIEINTTTAYNRNYDRVVIAIPHLRTSFKLCLKGKKRTKFFYTTNPTDSFINHALPDSPTIEFEEINLNCFKKLVDNGIETTKDRHIKGNYNNPFASIEINKIERWIKRDGDKITMKFFIQSRTRNFNCIFFSKSTNSTTVTFNMRTGNFVIITYSAKRRSKVKHFYCNSFSALNTSLPIFYSKDLVNRSSPIYKEFVESFDNIQFQLAIKNALNLQSISFGSDGVIVAQNFSAHWMPKFTEIKKIKLPDNAERLLMWYYPTERYLKKNNRKLIAAVLDRFRMKSNVTIKILHQYPYTDLIILQQLCEIFGKEYPKYIGNINEYFFSLMYRGSHMKTSHNDLAGKSILLDKGRERFFNISDSEKECVINILNDACNGGDHISPQAMFNSIIDHFKIIKRVKPYFPDVRHLILNMLNIQNMNARLVKDIQLKLFSIRMLFRKLKNPLRYLN